MAGAERELSTVIVHRPAIGEAEIAAVTGVRAGLRGYLPSRWPSRLKPTLLDFGGEPFGPFAASHDVAGDGRRLVVPLPGHTPGHVGLLVRNGRATLCAGDAVPSAAKLDALDPRVARFCRSEKIALLAAHESSPADRVEPTTPGGDE